MQRKNKVFLRGVINSDTPKGCHVSLPHQRGVAFRPPLAKGCRVLRPPYKEEFVILLLNYPYEFLLHQETFVSDASVHHAVEVQSSIVLL